MNADRIALVYRAKIGVADKESVGSGYVVGEDLILTALHVVVGNAASHPGDRGCEVRLLGEDEWRQANVVWPSQAEWKACARLDVALLRLAKSDDEMRVPANSEAPEWSGAAGNRIACEAAGYPDESMFDVNSREVHLMKGLTNSISGYHQGILYIGLAPEDAIDPAQRSFGASSWEGFSGAALFDGRKLIGVMIAAEQASRTLHARRIDRILKFESFRGLIGVDAESSPQALEPPHRNDPAPFRQSSLDVLKAAWTRSEVSALAVALLRCASFRDGQTRAAYASRSLAPHAAPPRAASQEADAEAIVAACANVDGALSRLLIGVRRVEEGTEDWADLLWLVVGLKGPPLSVALLKRLAGIAENARPWKDALGAAFARAATRWPDANFEAPASWQDAVALLADHCAAGGVPGPLLLAIELARELPRGHASLEAWIADAEAETGVKAPARSMTPKAKVPVVTLEFEVFRGTIQPDRGFTASSFLSVGPITENLGSRECGTERELKEWVARQIGYAAGDPRFVTAASKRIEFLLPDDLFGLDVDLWPLEPSKTGSLPIGLLYPVVVRSRWRARDPSAAKHAEDWRRWWRRLERTGCKTMHWTGSALASQPDSLFAVLKREEHCSVAFGFPSRGKPAMNLFGRALMAGAPVVVWSRRELSAHLNAEQDLRKWVAGRLKGLPDRLLKRRLAAREADKDDIGFHISLLCDEPGRTRPPGALLNDELLR